MVRIKTTSVCMIKRLHHAARVSNERAQAAITKCETAAADCQTTTVERRPPQLALADARRLLCVRARALVA